MLEPVKRRVPRSIKLAVQNTYVRWALKGASYKAGTTAVGLIILWWQTRH
ncbi:hypothetical protein PV341_34135 [Streptomyces sp. PA03-1a]|nr:hypothetical protein [Streptomyces sp. PA03-1a]